MGPKWQKPDSAKILDYISSHGQDTKFTDCFWKGCEPHPQELRRYLLYVKTMELFKNGKSVADISSLTGVRPSSVLRWTRFEQMPKLGHFLSIFLQLGIPKPGWVWLSVNNTSGHAIPMGPFVQVPRAISGWEEIGAAISQLKPLESEDGPKREYMFGFLIGMIIGDAAKSRSKNWHRHLGLVLSMKYKTNEKIGEFTAFSARNIGLRMHRISDLARPKNKPHGFYEWTSQASPLVDWIFNVCLGLKDGERTTYDPVKMSWSTDSPEDFRKGLVQGIAESDGSVSIASQTVEFWIGPNWDFFKDVLLTFNVKSFRNRDALSVTKNQINNLAAIPPFSPFLRTVRFLRFEKLAQAKHIPRGKRVPRAIRNFILVNSEGLSVPQISERILDRFGVVLSFEAVQRWVRKAQPRQMGTLVGESELHEQSEPKN
jgi:hypothetical protein